MARSYLVSRGSDVLRYVARLVRPAQLSLDAREVNGQVEGMKATCRSLGSVSDCLSVGF
jgi:hypothetical protein